jgi:hypothetical protein
LALLGWSLKVVVAVAVTVVVVIGGDGIWMGVGGATAGDTKEESVGL